jgi:hypothetical protein
VTTLRGGASEAKVAISKAPSPFALIPKDNLAEATAGQVHEPLEMQCRNNHIERNRRRSFYLALRITPSTSSATYAFLRHRMRDENSFPLQQSMQTQTIDLHATRIRLVGSVRSFA